MTFLNDIFLDSIIRASASTYNFEELARLGLQMDLNVSTARKRFLGNQSSPVYPEIIIWKPDFQGSNQGTAVIAEAIETQQTIFTNISKWQRLALIQGLVFNLVVPEDSLNQVKQILSTNKVNVSNLQTYKSTPQGSYIFTTHK